MKHHQFSTWLDALQYQAESVPDKIAFTFLGESGEELARLTFFDLYMKARSMASIIEDHCQPGERVLLLYPPGLDYVLAFYGCLFAGVVAVPLYSPQNKRKLELIDSIALDCDATLALTTRRYEEKLNEGALASSGPVERLRWLSTDTFDLPHVNDQKKNSIVPETVAYLQYTSGSTSIPKGVILRHDTTLRHSEELSMLWDTAPASVLVSWLPHFHDLGQVFSVLQPVYMGFSCVLIAPASFMKQPLVWLQAISKYRATHSAAPDFAYRLCASKVTPEEKRLLDLASWKTAVNGAEPVRSETISEFYRSFRECGFTETTHCPSYGLAEATLVVTANGNRHRPKMITCDSEQLSRNIVEVAVPEKNHTRTLVGNGCTVLNTHVAIVDPLTHTRCKNNSVGEIWVSGPGVASGYWMNDKASATTFRGSVKGENDGHAYLRTGDLGFMLDKELFITGRIKDLIVVRGTNHYPQDIEYSVESVHNVLKKGHCAAFSVDVDGEEEVVVVAERERYFSEHVDYEALVEKVRSVVARDHGIALYGVVIVRPGSIPKTTSGKIQRQKCKREWLSGALSVQAEAVSRNDSHDKPSEELKSGLQPKLPSASVGAKSPMNMSEMIQRSLTEWVIEWVQSEASSRPSHVDPAEPLSSYGLSSIEMFTLHGELEKLFGRKVPEEFVWDASSINDLAKKLVATTSANAVVEGETV